MNLREKFLWNIAVGFSSLVLLYFIWNQYSDYSDISKAYNKFKKEKVGSDEELQNIVADLQDNLNKRQNLKFIPKNNPLELMRVVSLSGISSSRGIKGIDCQTAWSNENGGFTALISGSNHSITSGNMSNSLGYRIEATNYQVGDEYMLENSNAQNWHDYKFIAEEFGWQQT